MRARKEFKGNRSKGGHLKPFQLPYRNTNSPTGVFSFVVLVSSCLIMPLTDALELKVLFILLTDTVFLIGDRCNYSQNVIYFGNY